MPYKGKDFLIMKKRLITAILAALLLSAPTVYHAIDWLTDTADRYFPENQ